MNRDYENIAKLQTALQEIEALTERTQYPKTFPPISAVDSQPASPRHDLTPKRNNDGVAGVGGWLLVLCIWLTIIAPLFSFASLSERASNEFQWFWGVSLVLFTLVTGILLWTGRWIGWRVANIYFWVILGAAWLAVFTHSSAEQIGQAIVTSILSGIWLRYLNTSKRVQNTYLSQRQTSSLSSSPSTPNKTPSDNLDSELRTLAKLRDDGIITNDDFNAKKQRLLGL